MSLSIQYEDLPDAQMRLQNSVVLYDGEPVYITDISQGGEGDPKEDVFRVYACPLPYDGAQKPLRKFISSRKFDLAPFPMGFMNYRGRAYYCSRLPRRQQRQGLSTATFQAFDILTQDPSDVRLERLLPEKEFFNCIKGTFPSFPEALRLIEKADVMSVAFSRSFAVAKDDDMEELVFLYHKKEKVGFIMEGELKLSKKGRCLRESLQEVGVAC